MQNKEPKNEIMRVMGNLILYSAGFCAVVALVAAVVFAFDKVRYETNQNSESIDAIKEDLSYIRTDMADLKKDVSELKDDVSELKDDVSVLKEDVTVLKEDVSAIKGKLNLPDPQASF